VARGLAAPEYDIRRLNGAAAILACNNCLAPTPFDEPQWRETRWLNSTACSRPISKHDHARTLLAVTEGSANLRSLRTLRAGHAGGLSLSARLASHVIQCCRAGGAIGTFAMFHCWAFPLTRCRYSASMARGAKKKAQERKWECLALVVETLIVVGRGRGTSLE